ncbi:MAG TPA: NADH-quinone oxidoreductase subunit A [Myxococcaceae bacterium]|nr:NADH-quinone oxidoreductase subunit A [Myxococcaceae bacterium]
MEAIQTSEASLAVAVILLALALGLGALALGVSRWRVKPRSREQNPQYEQGRSSEGMTWVQFRVRYAVTALLFVAFDMEMVFMFPWAVAFVRKGLVAFLDMLVFIAILGSAILFAWKQRAFEWEA